MTKKKISMRHAHILLLAGNCLLLSFAAIANAGPVDLNGTALPDANDGKTTVIDNSKEKETPPMVQQRCAAPKDTEVRIGLPAWMASVSGDAGVKGIVTEQDVDFTDILKRLDMMASGSLYFRYHRWELFADGLYLKVGDTADLRGILFDSARVSLKQAFAESFIGYRLINCEAGFLSIFAGDRWNYMQGDLHLRRGILLRSGRRFTGDIDWVDPVIGTSGRIHLWKPISFWAKGDVGGFEANSGSAFEVRRQGRTIVKTPVESADWSYQVQGGLEIQMTRSMYSQIGWRYLKNDYVSGGFTNKTDLNGPFLETGINF